MVGGRRSAIPGGVGCTGTLASMANVRLFASAREAAGRGRDELPGATVADVLAAACDRYGPGFADVLATCRIWVNGETVPEHTVVGPDDEVAVLPPVSGGASETGAHEPRQSIEETT
ncbi:hypothetical protein BH23ACT3_BH23ACT3_11780 [soil metagenome]